MSARDNAYRPLVDELSYEPSFIEKPMFGCLACYHEGRLKFVLADGDEPWNGVLVATERAWHGDLTQEFPALRSHPVLGKWLYLRADEDGFERISKGLVARALVDDARIGVVPKERKRTKRRARSKLAKRKRA